MWMGADFSHRGENWALKCYAVACKIDWCSADTFWLGLRKKSRELLSYSRENWANFNELAIAAAVDFHHNSTGKSWSLNERPSVENLWIPMP